LEENHASHSILLTLFTPFRFLSDVLMIASAVTSFTLVPDGGMRPRLQPTRVAPIVSVQLEGTVTELLAAVLPRRSAAKRSLAERARIGKLIETLEDRGEGESFLSDSKYVSQSGKGGTLLWDNYEVAYFDRSVDGGRGNATATKRGLRARLLGALFSLRFSLQNIAPPSSVVNFVGVRILGVPATITAKGEYKLLNSTAIAAAKATFGTDLAPGNSVRITFGPPRVAFFGTAWCGFSFELGGSAVQPPVDLCITYLDDRVRLGRAARGGRFVFTRGGVAAKPFADDWEAILARQPIGRRAVKRVALLALAAFVIRRCVAAWLPWHLGLGWTWSWRV
jgi:hypothetical protein